MIDKIFLSWEYNSNVNGIRYEFLILFYIVLFYYNCKNRWQDFVLDYGNWEI